MRMARTLVVLVMGPKERSGPFCIADHGAYRMDGGILNPHD